MAAEQEASWAELPLDLLTAVLSGLPSKDLAACAGVCTAWRAAADQEGLWSLQRQRDFPQADDATLAVLLERAGGGSSTSGGGRQAQRHSAAKLAYWWLARESTCERCQQRFTDGTNSPSACCFHTGILFSGGLMNGEALRYTCCNRRAHQTAGGRDTNGCTSAFHCGGRSAWQRHSTGVKPRELPPHPAGSGTSGSSRHDSSSNSSSSSSSSSLGKVRSSSRLVGSGATAGKGGSGGSSGSSPWGSLPGSPARPSPDPQEWHPNQRPGLLELPSRLFTGGSGGAA